MSTLEQPRPLRADAVRNRERVVAAAAEVFAERGIDASVPEVAERARVGKGTVYRSFPTKEHLVAAVVSARLRDFTRRAQAALAEPDAWDALAALLTDTAGEKCVDRTLTGALEGRSDLPELTAARAELWDAVGALMARAKAQGRMDEHARTEDLRVLWSGVARTLLADDVRDAAVWRRYAALVLSALRAGGEPPGLPAA